MAPPLHLLASDGGFAAGGRFVSLAEWDATLLMSLFRPLREILRVAEQFSGTRLRTAV